MKTNHLAALAEVCAILRPDLPAAVRFARAARYAQFKASADRSEAIQGAYARAAWARLLDRLPRA